MMVSDDERCARGRMGSPGVDEGRCKRKDYRSIYSIGKLDLSPMSMIVYQDIETYIYIRNLHNIRTSGQNLNQAASSRICPTPPRYSLPR